MYKQESSCLYNCINTFHCIVCLCIVKAHLQVGVL
nr:MAG TPA: hypothetical protein [Inoviridae sp.]